MTSYSKEDVINAKVIKIKTINTKQTEPVICHDGKCRYKKKDSIEQGLKIMTDKIEMELLKKELLKN